MYCGIITYDQHIFLMLRKKIECNQLFWILQYQNISKDHKENLIYNCCAIESQ